MSEAEHDPREATEAATSDAAASGELPEGTRNATADGAKPAGAKAAKKRNGFLSWLKELGIIVIAVVILMAILRHFVFQLFVIPSGSMEETLQVNDRIVVPQFLSYHRGDIVVFADPGGWLGTTPTQPTAVQAALEFVGLLPDTSQNYLVKRIIGVPGDDVKCCSADGRITVNGVEIDETSYLYRENGQPIAPSDFPFEVIVPADKYFVLGDHRDDSDDSRCHLIVLGDGAFVPKSKIQGVVTATVLPTSHWRTFSTPATFANVPNATSIPQQATIHADQVTCR